MPWLDDLINRKFEQIINHFWHQRLHLLVRSSEVRVCIDLDQPNPKILVKEEVETEELEHTLSSVWVHLPSH